jgi:mycothiol synthase
VSGAPPRLLTTTALTDHQVHALQSLVREAAEADGVPPLREDVLLRLQSAGAGHSILAVHPSTDRLLGFAHLDADETADAPTIEIAVHPTARDQGIEGALLDTVLALCPPAPSPIRLWAHGANAAAGELARAHGFRPVRQLIQMRRSLVSPLPAVALPTRVAIRTFDPDHDVPALQQLNEAAFTALPDQGGWTEDDIRRRIAEKWFDPDGLLLATSGSELLGFHWTKAEPTDQPDHEKTARAALGEVYVLAVHPHGRGRGIGRALTLAGLHHLRDQGVCGALLYVDGSNAPAKALYTSLGFAEWDSDMLFRR